MDYFFGMEQQETKPAKKRQEPEPASTSDIQPANDEDFTWSDAASSDMLFWVQKSIIVPLLENA